MEFESSTSELNSSHISPTPSKKPAQKVKISKPDKIESKSNTNTPSFVDDLLNKVKDKNNFPLILLVVALIAGGGYYFYNNKYKNNSKEPIKNITNNNDEVQQLKKQLTQYQENENKLLQERLHLINQLQMLGNQLQQQKPKPKIIHPNDSEINLDDIENDESTQVLKHKLTNEEKTAIKNKLA